MEPTPFERSVSLAAVPAGHTRGNLALGVVAGLAAALVSAVLWAALVSATNIKIGFAAVGVGYLVGLAVRGAGKGHDPVYGYAAAVLALLGCVAGDVFTDCVVVARQISRPVLDVVSHLTPQTALALLQEGFKPLDALFYFLAVSAGYRNAFSRQ